MELADAKSTQNDCEFTKGSKVCLVEKLTLGEVQLEFSSELKYLDIFLNHRHIPKRRW